LLIELQLFQHHQLLHVQQLFRVASHVLRFLKYAKLLSLEPTCTMPAHHLHHQEYQSSLQNMQESFVHNHHLQLGLKLSGHLLSFQQLRFLVLAEVFVAKDMSFQSDEYRRS